MLKQIIFATSNENKLREAADILGISVEGKQIELDELQSMDLDVIIRHKLAQAWELLRQPVMVDDSGIYPEQWHGFPGPFVKHALDTMGAEQLADLVGPEQPVLWDLKIGFTDGERILIGNGSVQGKVVSPGRGDGWGFDPFFIPDGSIQTYAEMGSEKKHQVSARSRALLDLKTQFQQV